MQNYREGEINNRKDTVENCKHCYDTLLMALSQLTKQ